MNGLNNLKIAALSPEDLETIREIEKKLGSGIRLVAVAAKDVRFVLEAKMAPNEWQRVDTVYPEITNIKAYHADQEAARDAKGWLKGFLINNKLDPKPRKRPIRIRRVVDTEHSE
jgi:hypothetical protein